jgi:hypothetical protein
MNTLQGRKKAFLSLNCDFEGVIIPLATKEHSFSYCSVQSNLGSLII